MCRDIYPDFIVLGKFIGCGLVLQDFSLGTFKFLARTRRAPTINCPMVTVENLFSLIVVKFMELFTDYPEVFENVCDRGVSGDL